MIGNDLVRVGILAGPLDALAKRGVNIKEFLSDFKLSPRLLTNAEATIEAGIYFDILDRCARVSDEELFSLHAGFNQNLAQLGLLGRAILSAPSLREALDCAQFGIQYVQDGGALDLEVRRGRCVVRYQHQYDSPSSRYDINLAVGLLANVVNNARVHEPRNLKLYLPSTSASTAITSDQCSFRFGSTDGMIEFDERILSSSMPHYERARFVILARFHELYAANSDLESGFEGIVECSIIAMMGLMKPSLQASATLLGVGERKLQRLLRQEGTNFRVLLDRGRKKVALHDLARGESMIDIAIKLGYDHPSNFSTAYRRWFGCAPSTHRNDFRG